MAQVSTIISSIGFAGIVAKGSILYSQKYNKIKRIGDVCNRETILFSLDDLNKRAIHESRDWHPALEEKGYDATNQIVGYLCQGTQLTFHAIDARNPNLGRYERDEIVEALSATTR